MILFTVIFWCGVVYLIYALIVRGVVLATPTKPWAKVRKWKTEPTPMQQLFTNEEIGYILRYKLRWADVKQAKKMVAAIKRSEG